MYIFESMSSHHLGRACSGCRVCVIGSFGFNYLFWLMSMTSYIMHYVGKRRVAAEERLMQEASERLGAETYDPIGISARVKKSTNTEAYQTLPYTPSCCATKDQQAPMYPIKVIRNVPYYTGEGACIRHQLDIYYSPQALEQHLHTAGGAPVTIHVHGGGWQRGDRANEWRGGPNAGRSIARHGMIGVVPSYRLAPPSIAAGFIWFGIFSLLITSIVSIFSSFVRNDFAIRWLQLYGIFYFIAIVLRVSRRKILVQHPGPVLDIVQVIAWTRAHLKEHVPQADTDKIFLSGHSAGAHLVSLVATDTKYLKQAGIEDISFLKGVCAVSGIYNLCGPVHPNPSSYKNFFFRLSYSTPAFGSSRDGLIEASPMTHASASTPPFLLMSATSDLGLESDAEAFYQHLKNLGVPVEWHTIQKTSHASIASHFEKHEAHQHLFRFIDKCCLGQMGSDDEKPQTLERGSNSSSVGSSRAARSNEEDSLLDTDREPYIKISKPRASPRSSPIPSHKRQQVASGSASNSRSNSLKKKKLTRAISDPTTTN